MDKTFKPAEVEDVLYKQWEELGLFASKINKDKTPFTIILPPPNANADLHLGHAMYVYEDIMIRYHKLLGEDAFWLPGADHAGFETQFVFEKHLTKQGKSRFDYDRETLYKMIWDFVHENSDKMDNQLRKLGFALDWSKKKFTLDEDVVKIVKETFLSLFKKGLVYRENKLVNYCVKDGTSFSDLEVVDKTVEVKLYFLKFPIVGGGFVEVATTRPETILGDVGVMVNPKDKRYKELIGKQVKLPISERIIPIIADEYVDMEFGTGAVKITPCHDFNDFEIAKKHNLYHPPVIGFDGKMMNTKSEYDGLSVFKAREKMEEDLKKLNVLGDVKMHSSVIKSCYKCGRALEPLPKEQWYVKVRPLADRAIEAIKKKEVVFTNKRFEKVALQWLTNFHDWNISRQIVWGIQIPAYKCKSSGEWFVSVDTPKNCICGKDDHEQDTDTFDTWFSSAQWPFSTLQSFGNETFENYYPTSVMETGYDILPWWVCRMLMMGLYQTGKVPFKEVYMHGLVRIKGQKMSKSKGNVINPLDMIEKYGADALRGALVFEVGDGTDLSIEEDKIRAMRNFSNKVWNIGRFLEMNQSTTTSKKENSQIVEDLKKEFAVVEKDYHKNMKGYKFSVAFGLMYEFIWHRFADFYIEQLKEELRNDNIEVRDSLTKVYLESLKLLHPFVPFVTDAVHKQFTNKYILES